MATTGRELSMSIPAGGLRVDVPPSQVGLDALIRSENLYYHDGRFQSRPGLTYLGELISGTQVILPETPNLLTDDVSNPRVTPFDTPTTDAPTGFESIDPTPPYSMPGGSTAFQYISASGSGDGLFGEAGLHAEIGWPSSQFKDSGFRSSITSIPISGGQTYRFGMWFAYEPSAVRPMVELETYNGSQQLLQTIQIALRTHATLDGYVLYSVVFTSDLDARYLSLKIYLPYIYGDYGTGISFSIGGMMLSAGNAVPNYWVRGGSPALNTNLMAQLASCPQESADITANWTIPAGVSASIVPATNLPPWQMSGISPGPYGVYGENTLCLTEDGGGNADTISTKCLVSASTDYVVSVWHLNTQAAAVGGALKIRYFTSVGVYISEEDLPLEGDDYWVRSFKAITTPVNCARLMIRFPIAAGTSLGARIGAIKVHEGSTSEDWSAGSTGTPATYLDERITGVVQYDHLNAGALTKNKLVLGTEKSWYAWNEGDALWEDVGDDTLDGDDNHVIFRTYEYSEKTYLLGANGESKIKKWDGVAAAFSEISQAPIARCIAVASTRVIAGNLKYGGVTYPHGIMYSQPIQLGAFDTWNAADIILLGDSGGEIVALMEMGDQMMIAYKTDSIYALAVQSGLYPFVAQLRSVGIVGPVSSRAVVAIEQNTHLYLGRDGALYMFDGGSPRSLGPNIQQYIRETMDGTYARRSYLVWNSHTRELWIWYPRRGHGGAIRSALVVQMDRPQQDGTLPCWPMRWSTNWDFSAGLAGMLTGPLKVSELGRMGDVTEALADLTSELEKVMLFTSHGKSYTLEGLLDITDTPIARAQTGIFSPAGSHLSTIKEIEHYFVPTAREQQVRVRLLALATGETPTSRDTGDDENLDISQDTPFRTEHRQTATSFTMEYRAPIASLIDFSGATIHYAVRGRR